VSHDNSCNSGAGVGSIARLMDTSFPWISMNDKYFYCKNCKEFTDAGGRWAEATLVENCIVSVNQPVDVEVVLAAGDFWDAPHGNEQKQLLDCARSFLFTHKGHGIGYGEYENFLEFDVGDFFWLDQSIDCPEQTPRLFAERYQMKEWSEVQHSIQSNSPWWWDEPRLQDQAKETFYSLVGKLR
jgi:hypothetical protein